MTKSSGFSKRSLRRRSTAFVCVAVMVLAAWPASAGILNEDLHLGWASLRDLTSDQFSEAFAEYRDRGFILTDIDVYPHGTELRYAMVWRQNPDQRGWAAYRDLTSSEYAQKWEEFQALGYRPLDVEGYAAGSSTRYAGIWVDNREDLLWSSHRNLTRDAYAELFWERVGQGYRLVDMEAYSTPDGLRLAAIWLENDQGILWAALRDMDRDEYQAEIDARSAAGFRVIDFESYSDGGEQLSAAIFEDNGAGRAWAMRSDRSERDFANLWRLYRDQGYRLVDIERYETPDGDRYAGLWFENNSRFRYDRKSDLDDVIETYGDANALPGISVAIIRDGTMLYRRGFGFADVDDNKVAHGETVYLAASVSKPIGGTLAAKLEADGLLQNGRPVSLDLTQSTSTYLQGLPDGLPEHHNHTVQQLLAHLGCVQHYGGPEPPIQYYREAATAVREIWDAALLSGCTVGVDRNYSTHAFTFVGAVLERATGVPIARLVREEIAEPHGLTSLRAQFETSSLVADYERATPYTGSNNETAYGDNSWKILGGGLEISAVDLARFGWKTLNGEIVDARVRDERLWKRVRSNRVNGLGWQVRTRNSRRIADHNGAWTGARSYLRVYRDDGLVVAIMSNRRGHAVDDVFALADDLAEIVLAP